MKSNEELNLPESLRYTDEHVWVRMEGGEAVIGISDFAQDQLGEIAFVDLPAVGVRFDAAEEIAELESILKQEGLSLKDIHTRFHNGVTALSKNPILIHMLAEFQEQFKKQRELNFVILPDEDRLEHWKVLEAIKSGSPAKARRAMHQHIDYIWKKRPHLFPGKKGPDKM